MEIASPPLTAQGIVYKDLDRKRVEQWYAVWYDHAGRLIRKRLGTTADIRTRRTALKRAFRAAQEYQAHHTDMLDLKDSMSEDERDELAARVAFPRQVVEREIRRICDRLARDLVIEDLPAKQTGQAGVQMFAERSGISGRQVHRMLEDAEYISVGSHIVDKICCEFDMIFNDFIVSASDWSEQRGEWSDRSGGRDAWPCGYAISESESEEDDIL